TGNLHAALLLPSEAKLAGKLPDVPDRNGPPPDGSGPEVRVGCRWQAGDQLDAAPANLLRTGCRRRHGRAHEFAAGGGMSPWRHGISAHQSSTGLPYLRSGRRMSSSGIQCRIWPRGLKVSRRQGQKTETGSDWFARYA